jgi:RNA polymerase sigma-70 factor (ECF subfamily)
MVRVRRRRGATPTSALETNRNALYKTMFDARKKLRAKLIAGGRLSAAG